MSQEVSKRLVTGLQPQYTPFISGLQMATTHLQTIDPNFQPDIQVGVLTNRFIAIFFGPTVVEKLGGCLPWEKNRCCTKTSHLKNLRQDVVELAAKLWHHCPGATESSW